MDGEGTKGLGRKLFVGDDGVGVWRAGMEVGNFITDGVGALLLHSFYLGRMG